MINDGAICSIKKSKMIDATFIVQVIIKKNKIIKIQIIKNYQIKNFNYFWYWMMKDYIKIEIFWENDKLIQKYRV